MTRHTRATVGILVGALAAGAVAVATPAAGQTNESGRGQIVAVQPLRTLATKDDVARELTAAEFKAGDARYGVDTYQLVYRTVDPAGRPTVASGLVALPATGRASCAPCRTRTAPRSTGPTRRRCGGTDGRWVRR